MESSPTLHMWHDYVCPFCNVEPARIMRIKEVDNLNLDVRFHPWPLETANGTQPRAEDEDTQAIFRQSRPIDSVDALSELAVAAGLDVIAFRAMLEDGRAERRAESAGADAKTQGIRGIPTLVLPDGSIATNPGLTMQRTAESHSIRDDREALRELRRSVARAERPRASHG